MQYTLQKRVIRDRDDDPIFSNTAFSDSDHCGVMFMRFKIGPQIRLLRFNIGKLFGVLVFGSRSDRSEFGENVGSCHRRGNGLIELDDDVAWQPRRPQQTEPSPAVISGNGDPASANVGTSGSTGERFSPVMARARILPESKNGLATAKPAVIMKETRPAATSIIAGGPPVRNIEACRVRSSA